MTRIAVVGASGQVGTELCILLAALPGVTPVAICRSRLSAALLQRCGVECRVGGLRRADAAAALLAGVDAVFDLSLPRGSESESRAANLEIIEALVAAAPAGAPYVFASTYMALGITEPGERMRHRLVSQTSYGAKKRLLERAAAAAGRRHGRDVYVLRLGQVHGEMQAVSRQVLASIVDEPTAVPAGPSNTVFVQSIAEGLVGIARGGERPGTYMMVSSPQWSWRELHEHFARRAGVAPELVEEAPAAPGPAHAAVAGAAAAAAAAAARHRELITGYLLPPFPDLERRARALHHVRTARADLAAAAAPAHRPYAYAYAGDAPGPRLASVTDSRPTAAARCAHVRAVLDAAVR